MKSIYIVTGANGFLGNNIIRQLSDNDDIEIRALVLNKKKAECLSKLNCKIYIGDVTQKDSLNEVFTVPKQSKVYVIHCAGVVYIKSGKDPRVYNVNVNGTKNIIDYVLKTKAKLVYVSSVHAITEKPNGQQMKESYVFDSKKVHGYYAKTKAETSNYVLKMIKEKNLNACMIHPSGIIGPYDYNHSNLTQLIIDFANKKLTACVKGGYNFVDVRDVATGAINACTMGKIGNCYILSNRYVEIKEFLDIVSDILNIKKIKHILPMWLAKITAPISELYYKVRKKPPLYTSYSLYTLRANSNFCNEKAKSELKFTTRPIKETLKDTIKWLQEEKLIEKDIKKKKFNK